MSQKRNALGIQWKKKWLMICGRNQWRGDDKGIILGIMKNRIFWTENERAM